MLIDIVILIAVFYLIVFVVTLLFRIHRLNDTDVSKDDYHAPVVRINNSTPDYKKIAQCPTYSIIYNNSSFPDNMNYQMYQFKAKYMETGRVRTKKIDAFSESEARALIKNLGYEDPIEISQIPFDPPTDAQRDACRRHGTSIPPKACKLDVSFIIDNKLNCDRISNPELLQYATEMKLKLSYYIGKKSLYEYIFRSLEQRDKISFFVFCVYRFLSNNRCGNLNISPYKNLFDEFSDKKLLDSSFVNSVNRYSGDELRYFGSICIGNNTYHNGGSTNTIAYKATKKFLIDQHLI